MSCPSSAVFNKWAPWIMSTRTQTTRLPTGFKDDDKDEDMRRQLWFNKSVELTSAPVSMSKRQGDGTWLKLGVNADVSVKWLLGAPESSRPVLYRYRQLALIYADSCKATRTMSSSL